MTEKENGTMEGRYEVSIPMSEYVNDAASPRIYFDTYDEAVLHANPLVKQGHCVVIILVKEDGNCE